MIYRTVTVKVKLRNSLIKVHQSVSKNIHVKAQLFTPIRTYSPDIDIYDGEYEVTPKFEKIELETENKVLTSDVVVNGIPVSITENLSGGNTVYIGG